MHIDHSKLIDLLVETSGIDKEKIEKQLEELVDDINEAIDEGEAYEVDGFGVFSAIGNNVVFIPADELATEINYKYVGMDAIEMDDSTERIDEPDAQDEDDPFAGLLEEDEKEDASSPELADETEPDNEEDVSSPFGIEEEDRDEPEIEKPGPEKWGIDTYKEEGAESMFSGLLGDAPKEESEQEEEHFKAVFDQEDENEDEDLERISEIERELSGEADEEDDEDDPFATLADEEENEEREEDLETTLGSAVSDDDNTDEEDLEEALSSSITEETDEDAIEPVPVIKNLASEKDEKKTESVTETNKKDKKRKPFKRPQKSKETGSQSAVLLIIIIILVLGGGIYGLGYFGVVNIPGITPEPVPTTAQTTPPASNPEVTQPQQEQTPSGEDTELATNETTQNDSPVQDADPVSNEAEQEPVSQVSEKQEAAEQAAGGEASYGLRGTINEAANDGYTIVVYSLTNEDNARSKVSELSGQGYRVILADIPHQQYGTLWRVSMGQFETMRDAALAAQDLGDPFTDNYFVTQIQ